MINALKILLFCFILNCQQALASDFSQQGATKLFTQMTNTLNNKDSDLIGKFFNYYMASDAIIYKKSILVSPDDLENPKSIKDIKYTREEYISLMQSIVTIGKDYTITYTVDSFQPLPDKYTAYASVSITETSTLYSNTSSTPHHNIVNTNCNYTLIDGSDSPKIAGANCIEKIILYQ